MKSMAVLGAAGKMGCGITLLLLQEIAWADDQRLILLDVNTEAFPGLRKYLRAHLKTYAERSINRLRSKYAAREDLVDNGDMITAFVEEAMDRVRYVDALEECRESELIFEAVIEDIAVKSKLLHEAAKFASPQARFLTNTSSIPIHILSEQSGLKGRLIGFHFYNPPPVQKLVEVILPEGASSDLREFAAAIGKMLRKTLVYSKDIAGFIGNGHFIREIMWACSVVRELHQTMPPAEALTAVNMVTQEFLLRPMGIFQLLDYVGIDVCLLIARIMTDFLPDSNFMDPLIMEMAKAGRLGGQRQDGSQKDGFLSYEGGRISGVYDSSRNGYAPYGAVEKIGPLPQGCLPWKLLSKDKDKKEKIGNYFMNLWEGSSLGSEIARGFLERSREIANTLVRDGVAQSLEDVDTVLKQGFYHLYGVEEPFLTRSSKT